MSNLILIGVGRQKSVLRNLLHKNHSWLTFFIWSSMFAVALLISITPPLVCAELSLIYNTVPVLLRYWYDLTQNITIILDKGVMNVQNVSFDENLRFAWHGRSLFWIVQKVICIVEIAVKYLALPNAQYIKFFLVSDYGSYEIWRDAVFMPILVHSEENLKVRRSKYAIIVTDNINNFTQPNFQTKAIFYFKKMESLMRNQ